MYNFSRNCGMLVFFAFGWKYNSVRFYLVYTLGHDHKQVSNFPKCRRPSWSSFPLSEAMQLSYHNILLNIHIQSNQFLTNCCQSVFSFSCLFASISLFLDSDLLSLYVIKRLKSACIPAFRADLFLNCMPVLAMEFKLPFVPCMTLSLLHKCVF